VSGLVLAEGCSCLESSRRVFQNRLTCMSKLATFYQNDRDILKSTEERRRFARQGGVRGMVSSSAACGFASSAIRAERKERKQCEIDQAAKGLFFYCARYFGPPVHFTRFMFDVRVTRACMTRVYLWIDARMKIKVILLLICDVYFACASSSVTLDSLVNCKLNLLVYVLCRNY